MSGDAIIPYDNSHEKPGAFNSRATVEGILIPFAVSATVGTIFLLLLFNHGFGKHFATVSPANRVEFLKFFYVALLSYTASTALMKLCLLTQYLRLFYDDERARKVCWFFIVFCALWGVAFTAIALVPCAPLSGFWDWNEPSHCYGFGSRISGEIAGTFAAHVSTNVILDLIVLAIPIPLYFKTFKQKKQRVGFSFMILLGILINAISIWRLHVIIKTRATTYPVPDPTFYGPTSIVLAALEVDLASIVASIPVFWPLLTHGWDAIFVTQEVHVTRHHRRLSGHDTQLFELRSPSRRTSDMSLKLMSSTDAELQAPPTPRSSTPTTFVPVAEQQHQQTGIGYGVRDPYVRGRVYPLEGAGLASSQAEVVSEGQRGFERNFRDQILRGGAPVALGDSKLDDVRVSVEHKVCRDELGERPWGLSVSRKSSQQRF
ncbi:hypothetical protein F4777DRAFT_598105 [Nemania sp. FL0916]|nr:hypothetical protein F4777DRAFT_598105 [Nemania sp. FL0916]